jgi:hypothetical protein
MTRKFTTLGTSIAYILTIIAISIYLKLPIWAIFLAILGLIHSDYKVVVNKKGIEFYSFFRNNGIFKWNEIEKIEFRKPSLLKKYREFIIVYYYGNLQYKFNLYFISSSDDCIRLINSYAKRHNIPVEDFRDKKKRLISS